MDPVARLKELLEEWGVPAQRVELHPERRILQVFLPEERLCELPPGWVLEGKTEALRAVLGHYIAAPEGGP